MRCHFVIVYVTVSGKTNLLAEIEKVGFLLYMDSINTRLVVVPVATIGCFLELDQFFC